MDEAADAIQAASGMTNAEVERVVKEAKDNYREMTTMLIIQIVLNVLIGQGIGQMVGQHGISRPLRAMARTLHALAYGDFSVDVPGIERGDEVGEVARAAMIFKEMGLEKQRLEQQQKDNERRAAEEKKAFMLNLADSFERTVGRIVKSVSESAVNLKASALCMTHLSESTGQQSGIVATASELSSTNVASVASASEQLSASIAEIGKQIVARRRKPMSRSRRSQPPTNR